MIHALKTEPKYFIDIANGKKTFEIRKFDRSFTIGDFLALNEFDPEEEYTGRCMMVEIVYMLDEAEYCKEGYVVLGIKPRCISSTKLTLFGEVEIGSKVPVYSNK